ncbi:C6 transcription factor [Colletotrichum karsti]|uniref:C6 transcription factor n=1 Tax=Colletotrichum karsti TaxID=1095194 RepID=A0A9P6HZQ5_9PEZI|nr:C6 transcription factor [Colletotrichum karsti]KAF9874332.1 C6 transcription factor [Colletotrichum karsti]
MQPERKYRSILPGPPANNPRSLTDDDGDAASSSASGGLGGQEGSKRKRRATTKACNSCREKKIGCNGLQPCSHCQRRGLACEYATISKTILNSIPSGMKLLNESTAKTQRYAAELLSILRSLPDDQVRDVLQQLRAGGEASNIVASLRGQLHSAYDVPFHGILHGVPPPDQNSLEFELMVRHAIAYSPWAPTEVPHLDFELSSSSRPSQSLSVESPSTAVSPMSTDTPSPLPPTESESSFSGHRTRIHPEPRDSSTSSQSLSGPSKFGSRESGLPDLPVLCDERLQKLDPSTWTNVPIPPEAARRAISLYLETDHTITALFDVDLFLDSLVSGSSRFCSKLLFNSLLSWACQGYTAYEPEASAWSYAFYDEAIQLLEEDWRLGFVAPVTVSALLYLSMSSMCHAKNMTDASKHLESAIDLAKSIGLFGIPEDEMVEAWPETGADMLWEKATAQTAWGSFVYITTPIPGYTNDIGEALTSDEQQLPAYAGQTFSLLCKLVLIAHDMIWMNYASNSVQTTAHSMVEAMELVYRRYLAWADDLPLELVRSGESAHHVLLLHTYLHAFVLDLFRPLFRHGDAMRTRLESFTSQQASPEAVCSASATQLKRIAITYLQNCPSASYSFLWQTALLYVANAALRESAQAIDSSEQRSDFRTCIIGYQKLQRCFRLPQAIVRGLLSMVLREGLMTSSEARAIIKDSEEKGKHHPLLEPILAPFVVDLDICVVDRSAALVDRLAAEFDEIAILNEFTMVTAGREGMESSADILVYDADS